MADEKAPPPSYGNHLDKVVAAFLRAGMRPDDSQGWLLLGARDTLLHVMRRAEMGIVKGGPAKVIQLEEVEEMFDIVFRRMVPERPRG